MPRRYVAVASMMRLALVLCLALFAAAPARAVTINPNEGILWKFGVVPVGGNYTGPCTAGWIVSSTTTAARALVAGDACRIVPVNCVLDLCQIQLPAATFAAGTQIVLQNTSNATVVPITPIVSAYIQRNSVSASSQGFGFSVINQHDAILISINYCSNSSTCAAGTPPTVTNITDTAGNASSCSFVVGQSLITTPTVRDELWVCPNTVATGTDNWTITLSGAGFYIGAAIAEFSGMALSSPAEVSNAGTTNAAAWTLSASGAPTVRNDLIYASSVAEGTGNTIAPGQRNLSGAGQASGGQADEYWLSSGGAGQIPVMSWTQNGTPNQTAQVIAAFKPATPLSAVTVAPAGGVLIYGVPVDSLGNAPLMPGAALLLTVDAAGNYEAQYLTPPQGIGMVDEITAAAYTTSEPWDCYKTDEFTNWVAAQTVTIPVMVPGCVLNMIQGGTQAPKIQPGIGVVLPTFPVGDAHLAGQNATAFVQIGSGGNVDVFGGQIAP